MSSSSSNNNNNSNNSSYFVIDCLETMTFGPQEDMLMEYSVLEVSTSASGISNDEACKQRIVEEINHQTNMPNLIRDDHAMTSSRRKETRIILSSRARITSTQSMISTTKYQIMMTHKQMHTFK
jgi:hypothetical protein